MFQTGSDTSFGSKTLFLPYKFKQEEIVSAEVFKRQLQAECQNLGCDGCGAMRIFTNVMTFFLKKQTVCQPSETNPSDAPSPIDNSNPNDDDHPNPSDEPTPLDNENLGNAYVIRVLKL